MSKFYATIEGNRQPKTCTGTNGIATVAQSYNGSVRVDMAYLNDGLHVRIGTNDESSTIIGYDSPIFNGTFEEFKNLLKLSRQIKEGEVSIVKNN